jgi:hypothetical protein
MDSLLLGPKSLYLALGGCFYEEMVQKKTPTQHPNCPNERNQALPIHGRKTLSGTTKAPGKSRP